MEADGTSRVPYVFSSERAALVYREAGALFTLPLEGDLPPTRLWADAAGVRHADLSPDGRWIAYESDVSGENEIWVRPFPNVEGGAFQISTEGGMWPLWNPDGGHELFYVALHSMMAVTYETEPTFSFDPPELLFDTEGYGTPDNVGINRRIDIALDGRFLMFKESAGIDDAPEPILIQNWTDELQRLVPTN